MVAKCSLPILLLEEALKLYARRRTVGIQRRLNKQQQQQSLIGSTNSVKDGSTQF